MPSDKFLYRRQRENVYFLNLIISMLHACKLCDGSFIDSEDSFAEYPSLFGLPNAMDKVIGVTGDSHHMANKIGNKSVTLTESNLPSHCHYLLNSGSCQTASTTAYPYLTGSCFPNNWDNVRLGSSTNLPNTLQSGTVATHIVY